MSPDDSRWFCSCGYEVTGLEPTKCPECGADLTVTRCRAPFVRADRVRLTVYALAPGVVVMLACTLVLALHAVGMDALAAATAFPLVIPLLPILCSGLSAGRMIVICRDRPSADRWTGISAAIVLLLVTGAAWLVTSTLLMYVVSQASARAMS